MAQSLELFHMFRNVIVMLKRRHYNISNYEIILNDAYTPDLFMKYLSEMRSTPQNYTHVYRILKTGEKKGSSVSVRNSMSFYILSPDNEITLIFFATSSTGSNIVTDQMSLLSQLAILLKDQNVVVNNIIIIGSTDIHSQARSIVSDMERFYFVQFFLDKEISSDPTDYEWGSQVEIYTKEQTSEFFRNNNLTPGLIPAIPISDIVLKYLGVKDKLVVKLTRKSFIPETCDDESIAFRYTYIQPVEKSSSTKKKK